MMAVAITGFLLLFLAPTEVSQAQESAPGAPPVAVEEPVEETSAAPEAATEVRDPDEVIPAAAEEARRSARRLRDDFFAAMPKLLVAIAVILLAILIVKIVGWVLNRVMGDWQRGAGIRALVSIGIWLLAVGIIVSVVAGDARALVGSLGLVGLALSWALQTPIESFAGWLMNSFRSYYRVGDRIAVGEVFGDVYKIDFLNTTVWEIGRPADESSFVRAEQPTGRLITFPNSEVLAGSIVNFTRDFPWVWDEYDVAIGNESDLRYAMKTIEAIARRVFEGYMEEPAEHYEAILSRAGLARKVAREPEIFVNTTDWSTNVIIRYLVDARERRIWKSRLVTELTVALAQPEHRGKILPAYPRRQLQYIGPGGKPVEP